jgi:hypothetical protein
LTCDGAAQIHFIGPRSQIQNLNRFGGTDDLEFVWLLGSCGLWDLIYFELPETANLQRHRRIMPMHATALWKALLYVFNRPAPVDSFVVGLD